MKILSQIFKNTRKDTFQDIEAIKEKVKHFLEILEHNKNVLKLISDLEEKSHGEYLFDLHYIKNTLGKIKKSIISIIENVIFISDGKYKILMEKLFEIDEEIENFLKDSPEILPDYYTLNINTIGREKTNSVGGKNAQLGELRNKIEVPVPEGFAISSWAYKYFLEENDLQKQINQHIKAVNIRDFNDLKLVSEEIRELIIGARLPDDLYKAIKNALVDLKKTTETNYFAVRSSAIGEDTGLSFAGRYASFLGVSEREIADKYKSVVASKFSPRAIYYFLSHSLYESELAMSASCIEMVDAYTSGIVYTHDPLQPDQNHMLINAIYGLGSYLVDGVITPDTYEIARDDFAIIDSHIVRKTEQLVLDENGKTRHEMVPIDIQQMPTLNLEQLRDLADYAGRIENHYGKPQDIEWAIDRKGKIFILQTRPLRTIKNNPKIKPEQLDGLTKITEGGYTVCPGAGFGRVHRVFSADDLQNVPKDVVLVAPTPFPGLLTALEKARALITKVGSAASHMATIAREYRVPTIVGLDSLDLLEEGAEVTVDATHKVIYEGINKDLVVARKPEFDYFEDTKIFNILSNVLTKTSTLNLINSSDDNFRAENCNTIHDITRFSHQKSMEEMFFGLGGIDVDDGIRLDTHLPLSVYLIYLDKNMSEFKRKKLVDASNLDSPPMEAYWSGVMKEGWPAPLPKKVRHFTSMIASKKNSQKVFSQKSFAILSKEFILLSLKMGYHFTTIEAMCTSDPDQNYIKMQFKEGGAAIDRRSRRIKLITTILSKIGFVNLSKNDYLDTMINYIPQEEIIKKLRILGRLSMLTKQLDMALSNDQIAEWYTRDFIKKLGVEK
jgi:pyruvate, water dikinase